MAIKDDKLELKVYTPIEQFLDEGSTNFYPKKMGPPDWESYGSDYGESPEEKIHLREILRRIFKHKWLILSLVVIVTTLVSIQAFRIKPWYSASTILEIGKENTMTLKSGDITLNDDSDPNYLININTKILALNNPELFEDVVTDLQLDQNPTVLESFQSKPFLSSLNIWKPAAPKSELPIVINNQAVKTENETVKSPEEMKRLAPFIAYVQRNVTYEPIRNTKALKISFTDGDPVLAASISNSIAKFFRQRSFDTQTEKFTKSSDWLDRTTRELKAKVEASEEALTKYTRENKIYSTEFGNDDKSQTLTTSKLAKLHEDFIKAQTERILKSSLYDQIKAGRIAEIPEVFTDPKITAAQSRLDTLNTQMAELKVKFGDKNPKIMEIQNQIEVLNEQVETSRNALEGKLKADYERAAQDEASLQIALNSAKSAAVNENQAAIKYNILRQDAETTRGLYKDFLEKSSQSKLIVAEQNNSIKVIQNAQAPGGPVGPNRMLIILTGLFASLTAGIGLAFFLEYLDNTVKSLDDVERYAQLPAIGLIPSIATLSKSSFFGRRKQTLSLIKSDEDETALQKGNSTQLNLMNSLDNNSMMGEAYRALRTSLLLSSAGSPPKTILVTSGRASEGKTTTAVNTAISLAQLGSKVLIIDCDLRRPSVHKHFGITHHIGLTNYLASNTELSGLIQELDIPNLSVMTAGPIPPNPAELLSSNQMKDMLKLLSESYDHIILDSPPIINVTDPIILSTIVDGTIMVIHSGKTTREVVQRSRQELQSVRSKIFGVVLNNVNLRRDGYDYYYYYRYSNYYKSNDGEPAN